MRFGLPTGADVAVLAKPQFRISSLERSSGPSNLSHIPSPPQSASQILNESLIKLEALHVSNISGSIEKKTQQWKEYLDKSTNMVQSSMSFLDEELDQDIKASQMDVRRIIEHQIRLREEEQRRLLELEQERQRKIKEELERKQREEEERKRLAEEKKVAEQKRLAEEQRLKKEKEEKEKLEKKNAELLKLKAQKEAAAKKAAAFSDPFEIEKTLLKYRQDIKDIKLQVADELNKNKELKKSVGVIKRKVNVKLGQLSNSQRQLEAVTNEVINLISPTTSQPLAYKWLLNFVSKAIVSQAETEVTVKPAAALPLGILAYNLLCRLDGLEYYLSARFVKKCCLVIGYTGSIDTEEGRVRMGWRRSDGKWEAEVKYEERMGGILSVWAVMGLVNKSTEFPLFNMTAEWRFLARMLNTKRELLSDVHFVAVCNWWEAAAEQFYAAYGQQAKKVLIAAISDWATYGMQKGFPAATRLHVLGEDLFTRNNFNALKAMER